ncbi:DUF7520 family protein [Halogranum rubrum]
MIIERLTRERLYLVGMIGTIVGLAASIGYTIGLNTSSPLKQVVLFGVVPLPFSPLLMAGYGSCIVLLSLSLMYSTVSLLSRYDSDALD